MTYTHERTLTERHTEYKKTECADALGYLYISIDLFDFVIQNKLTL